MKEGRETSWKDGTDERENRGKGEQTKAASFSVLIEAREEKFHWKLLLMLPMKIAHPVGVVRRFSEFINESSQWMESGERNAHKILSVCSSFFSFSEGSDHIGMQCEK